MPYTYSGALASHGVYLSLSTSTGTDLPGVGGAVSTQTYVLINELKSVTGPGLDRAVIDVTNHQSTAKEKVPGLRDGGAFTFNLNFISANSSHNYASGLLGQWAKSDVTHYFRLNFPVTGASTTTGPGGVTVGLPQWDFVGFVKAFHLSFPVDGVIDASLTVEISNGGSAGLS